MNYLVTTSTCPNCKIACSVLDKANFQYEKIIADETPEKAVELGIKQAPTLVLGTGQKYCGVSEIKKFISSLED